jgi:ATP-dependent Clp protease ATP-binding subunit ClpC
VFERFTDRARRVVVLAQEEARLLNHNYIGTEHILLGLANEGEGIAARALQSLDVALADVRHQVVQLIGRGTGEATGHVPFTPRAKKVLELSLREALTLGHNYIGTEHLLLGLVREGEGVGAQVLKRMGADVEPVRRAVAGLLSGYSEPEVPEAEPQEAGPPAAEKEPRCPRCGRLLAETAAYRSLEIPGADAGAEPRAVTFAFCRGCGTWLGSVA